MMKYNLFKGLLFCGCMMSVVNSNGADQLVLKDGFETTLAEKEKRKSPRPPRVETDLPKHRGRKIPSKHVAKHSVSPDGVVQIIANASHKDEDDIDELIEAACYDIFALEKLVDVLINIHRGDLYPTIRTERWHNMNICGASFNDDFSVCTGLFMVQA